MRFNLGIAVTIIALTFAPCATAGSGVRIKDITTVEGARGNQLDGFGLVVGLDGTGGKSLFTQQVAVDMLQRQGVSSKITAEFKTDAVFKSDNIAAVMVTAEIPPFARRGSRLDVTVSALDDADSLQGGTLLITPLKGVDGQVYAVAQGPLSIGGFSFSGKAASAQKNHPTTGRIANGATVEREALGQVQCNGHVRLLLNEADYATAESITKAVNAKFPNSAEPIDAGTVQIEVPKAMSKSIANFLNEVGQLEVTPDTIARIVINERTGTVVAGENVKIATVAIAHGNLSITTAEEPQVSQPAPFSRGETTVVDRTRIDVTEHGGGLQIVEKSVTVAELARALNALGVSPRDLIAIFQALKQAGALHAELLII